MPRRTTSSRRSSSVKPSPFWLWAWWGIFALVLLGCLIFYPPEESSLDVAQAWALPQETPKAPSSWQVFGAGLSDVAFQLFGWGAWVLPFLIFWTAVGRMRNRRAFLSTLMLGFMGLMLSFSLLFSTSYSIPFSKGGLVGATLLRFLIQGLGDLELPWLGSFCLICSSALIFLSLPHSPLWEKFFTHLFSLLRRPRSLTSAKAPAFRAAPTFKTSVPQKEPLKQRTEPRSSRFSEEPLVLKEESPLEPRRGRPSEPEPLLLQDGHTLPSLEMLKAPTEDPRATLPDQETLDAKAAEVEAVLQEFGVRGEIQKVRPGPVVTLYELTPAPGVKSSRVIGLADDIARSMSAVSARIAVIPGQNALGIELPNEIRQTVYFRELLEDKSFNAQTGRLNLALGKDIGGTPVTVDLARMPHLLVAGTTGSGKSVAINTMILSLLFRLSPERCKFIMIDPKMLELSIYEGIPHLLAPVVTEPKKAIVALKWTVKEMEERYRSMARLGVRNIDGYNTRLAEAREKEEALTRRVQTGFDPETGRPQFEDQPLDLHPLPYIVVVVDELADLMLVAGKEIEATIQRLAQMARAAGIHLIMATQRPSVDVITGTIKANFPTRISFQVTSKIDSRTILGEQGAEQLLGQGDMLYMASGGRVTRVHGPFVSDREVEKVVEFLRSQGEPQYLEEVTADESEAEEKGFAEAGGDDLYQQAVNLVLQHQKASTSFIQRHLQIGYNRAARLIEQMETAGVVSAPNHVGKREILGN